jgi:hypothetical protein
MDAEQATEFRERQLLIVDVDGDFPIRPTAVDNAAEYVAARDPLIAVFVVVDLLLARRFLDDRLILLLQEPPLRVEDLVVHLDDIGVAHRRDAGTYDNACTGNVRVGVVDDRVASLAGYSHLIDQNVGRPLWAHFPTPRRPDDSHEKPALLQEDTGSNPTLGFPPASRLDSRNR